MGFLKKIGGILGLGKDEHHHRTRDHGKRQDSDSDDAIRNSHADRVAKGFAVPVQVAVERPNLGPLIVPCDGDGGVQGLKWYAERFRVDEDGDVGDEFLDQVSEDEPKAVLKFEVKYSVRPAKVTSQIMSFNGKLQQCVDCRGRLLWV